MSGPAQPTPRRVASGLPDLDGGELSNSVNDISGLVVNRFTLVNRGAPATNASGKAAPARSGWQISGDQIPLKDFNSSWDNSRGDGQHERPGDGEHRRGVIINGNDEIGQVSVTGR